MDKLNLKNISNAELLKLRNEKKEEFERVRFKIVEIYNYWEQIEYEYSQIFSEINKRNIQ
jgi:hypothetical protein